MTSSPETPTAYAEIVDALRPNPFHAPDLVALASEDDLLVSVRRGDLLAAVGFIIDTVQSFGPDDVALYLDGPVSDATLLAERLTRVRAALSS